MAGFFPLFKEQEGKASTNLVPALVISCIINVALGLTLVLISIERTELGYNLKKLEEEVKAAQAYYNGLEVERGRLLSPYALKRKADELGLHAAKPGQIRRLAVENNTRTDKKER